MDTAILDPRPWQLRYAEGADDQRYTFKEGNRRACNAMQWRPRHGYAQEMDSYR